MTQVRVTKARIIKALRTEPLCPGSWISSAYKTIAGKKGCTVCAVGAVLRNTLSKKTTTDELWDVANMAVSDGEFTPIESFQTYRKAKKRAVEELKSRPNAEMAALSLYFESLCMIEDDDATFLIRPSKMKKIRALCIEFVQQHFREHVLIEIDYCRPAPGIEVVKDVLDA